MIAAMDAIPFTYLAPQIPILAVEARAGERPLTIVFDLGAVGPFPLFLSDATAAAMGLSLSEPVIPAQSTAVGSQRHSYRTGRLADFRLGPLALRDATISVTAVVDSLASATGRTVHGIVGHDLVKDRRIALDYVTKHIDFDAPPGAPDAALPIAIGPRRPITLVTARVNGAGPFTLEIDTGATASSLSPGAARRARVKAFGTGRLVGAGGPVTVRVGAAQISFGGVTRMLPMVNITPAIERIGEQAGVKLDGVIGADFLAGTRLTLDYPARSAWISEPRPQQ